MTSSQFSIFSPPTCNSSCTFEIALNCIFFPTHPTPSFRVMPFMIYPHGNELILQPKVLSINICIFSQSWYQKFLPRMLCPFLNCVHTWRILFLMNVQFHYNCIKTDKMCSSIDNGKIAFKGIMYFDILCLEIYWLLYQYEIAFKKLIFKLFWSGILEPVGQVKKLPH